MANASNTLRIIISGDASGAVGAVDDVSKKLGDAARAWAAFEGIGFLRDVTEDAAGLIESQNAVDQVFQSNAQSVRAFGEGAADSLGQSEQAANQATATFGNLFTAFGVGGETAAQWSQTLVSLASDYAAFKNVDVSETITSFQAIMAGEIEPARRLGIDLREATLQSKAMELGLIGQGDKLDALTKLQATYAQVMEDSATVSGQFTRESEGLLGQQMIAKANWEDAKASLGMQFIPAMILATKATAGFGTAFAAIPGPMQTGAIALAGWAVVGSRVSGLMANMSGAAGGLGSALPAISSGLRNNVSNLSGSTLGFAAGAAAIVSYTAATEILKRSVDRASIGADLDYLTVSLENLGRTGEMSGEVAKFGEDWESLASAFRNSNDDFGDAASDFIRLGQGLDEAAAAKEDIEGLDDALATLAQSNPEAAAAVFAEISSALIAQGISAQEVAQRFNDYFTARDNGAAATANATAATEEDTAANEDNMDALERLRAVNERYVAMLERRRDRQDSLRSAQEGLESATQSAADAASDLADAEAAALPSSEENVAAREQEADALKGVQDAMAGVADAQEGVQDALAAVTDAEEGVVEAQLSARDAQQALNDARADAAEKLRDLTEAAEEARRSEEEADLSAREKADEAARGGRGNLSDLEKERLNFDAEKAREDAEKATRDRQEAEAEEAAARARGVEGDAGVIDAKRALVDANDGVRDALGRVAEAEDGVREAVARVADANEAVADANRRVQDAERNTAQVAEETAARVQEAKQAAEDATREVIDAEQALAGAGLSGEAAIRAQQTALREMAEDYAPGSPYRVYIEDLIRDLGFVLGGTVGIGGDYASPDAADRGRPGAPRGDIPQDETRDPAQRNGGLTVNYMPTVNGSARRERELLEQGFNDQLDQVARRFR